MKKFLRFFVVALFVVCPLRVLASGIIGGAISSATEAISSGLIIEELNRIHLIEIVQFAKTAKDTYDDLQESIEAAKRAWNNIRSVADARSVGDFMKWFNRQLYLEREVEERYNKVSVKVGKNAYKLHEIDQIPDALRNSFRDPREGDFTEQEKKDMWVSLGLSPSNYTYLKTWQERNDKIAKRILTYSDVFADEHEEAAARNRNIMGKYLHSGDDLDINEITKEAHITAMNTEMAIREQTRLMIEMHEYNLSRDRMFDTPPNQPRRSDFWDEDPYGSITAGHGVNSYENW